MADPTPEIDWYPPSLRDHGRATSRYAVWDCEWDAGSQQRATVVSDRDRAEALRALGGAVYACRVAGGLIKIGYSEHLDERRRRLKGDILAVMPGTSYADEQAIHRQLAAHVHHGREWYYPTPAVMRIVNDMRDAIGLEPIAA